MVYVRGGKPLKWMRVGRLCLRCLEFSPDAATPARKAGNRGDRAGGGAI